MAIGSVIPAQAGIQTLEVLVEFGVALPSGSTGRDDLKRFAYSPDFIAESIADLTEDDFMAKIRRRTEESKRALAEF